MRLSSRDDCAPLLLAHDVYTFYPVSLLSKQRFDQISIGLSRLTPYDPTGVDVSRCQSINEWLTLLQLPADLSTKPKRYDRDLKSRVDTLRLSEDWYKVISGRDGEGAVIVSNTAEPVEFFEYLADRTVNLVPLDTLEEVLGAVDSNTQSVGVFPDELLPQLRHRMALHGGQRMVSLGFAFNGPGLVGPQDGMEPLRRMCKWIISEQPLPGALPVWECKEGETALVA
jgi:hypothetical protein